MWDYDLEAAAGFLLSPVPTAAPSLLGVASTPPSPAEHCSAGPYIHCFAKSSAQRTETNPNFIVGLFESYCCSTVTLRGPLS